MNSDDRRACYDLALRYARAADRRDYAAFRDVFTPDGRLSGHMGDPATAPALYTMDGIAQIEKAMAGLERYARTLHVVANQLVDDDGRGETYCVAHHVYRDDDGTWMNYTMFIRYLDRFAKTPAGWRIAERRLAMDVHQRAPLGETLPE